MSAKRWFLDARGAALIRDEYDSKPATITRLTTRLDVPRWQVRKWAVDLGVARTKELNWSPKDVEYLSANYHRTAVTKIARHLGRTRVAVRLKAKRLLVRKHGEHYTVRSLCLALGEDHHKVDAWIDRGLLPAGRRHTERENDSYLILEKDVRRFIIAHPTEINVRRVDGVWLIDLLANGG